MNEAQQAFEAMCKRRGINPDWQFAQEDGYLFFDGFAAAQSGLTALREELQTRTADLLECGTRRKAAEQRNAACNAEIVAMVESALMRSFSLGQVYWQQADSDSTCQQNKSDQTMEVQTQHILNIVKSINELTKPTESGAE